jgi:hypothetical protein
LSQIVAALPVRIELDYNHPYEGAPAQWAIVLTSHEGFQILLPLAIPLRGASTTNVTESNVLYAQGWTIDQAGLRVKRPCKRKLKYYNSLEAIFQAFAHSIVLHAQDTEMIFKERKGIWQPRRYMCAWKLYGSPIQAGWPQKNAISSVEGTYISVNSLVNRLLKIGSQVSFKIAVDRPFQLLRLSHFALITRYDPPQRYDLLVQKLIDITYNKSNSGTNHVTPGENERAMKRQKAERKAEKRSLESILQRGNRLVDEEPRCQFPNCPFPCHMQVLYCKYHVEPMTQLFRFLISKRTAKWRDVPEWKHVLPIPENVKADIGVLRRFYEHQLEDLWVVDFEFVSVSEYSPVPTQMAIRLLNGDLLLRTNINYDISLDVFIEKISQVLTRSRHIGEGFLNSYRSYETNGLRPLEVRHKILELGYSSERTQILSWVSAQDMQCFQRLLHEGNDLLVPRHSHTEVRNFQPANVHLICQRLFSQALDLKLQSVHCGLTRKDYGINSNHYHDAGNVTEALMEIVQELLKIT